MVPSTKSFLKFLRSMGLAVTLIVLIAVVSVPSTLIPQGQSVGFYAERYGELGSRLIIRMGMNEVFGSWPFFIVCGLFVLNLGYCSIWRFTKEAKKSGRRRHGPDLLHLGLLVFTIGAVISAVSSENTPVLWMEEGDSVRLPKGGIFLLQAFDSSYYDDGRPKSWVSRGLYQNADGETRAVSIAVNSPLRLEGLKIYQNSFRPSYSLNLIPRPGSGAPSGIREGEEYEGLIFATVRIDEDGHWVAVFIDSNGRPAVFSSGNRVEDAVVDSYDSKDITGLVLSRDPGVHLVFISFIPVALGLFFIVLEKRKQL